MFKFKKKDKNLDKDKNSAKSKNSTDKIQKDVDVDAQPVKKSFFKKIFSLKFMIIFLLLLIIIGGAAFAGWFFFLKKKDTVDMEQAETKESVKTENPALDKDGKPIPPPEPDFPDIVDLEPFEKIKLQQSEAYNQLTLKISVELIKPDMRKTFEDIKNIDKIRNAVQTEIKKMSWLILRSPEGKLIFKYALIRELNKVLPSKMIKNIYFTSFILT